MKTPDTTAVCSETERSADIGAAACGPRAATRAAPTTRWPLTWRANGSSAPPRHWQAAVVALTLGLVAQAPFVSARPVPPSVPARFQPLLDGAGTDDATPAAAPDTADPGAPGTWAMLETVTPEVQWLAAGFTSWLPIPTGQIVHAGDRVRTGSGAAARLDFAPDTALDVGAASDLTVRRLEQGPTGNLVLELFVASGTTSGPTLPASAPAARVEIETPAARVVARRAGPRLDVGADGTTHVVAPSDAPGGGITVEAKDALATTV